MHLLLALFTLLFAPTAHAGGVGITAHSGWHGTPVYFYDRSDELRQYRLYEGIVSVGTGLEVVLGDKDDRVLGIFRGYWMMDAPERDPSGLTQSVASGDVIAAWRDEPSHFGMATVGVQWGFLGSPDTFQVVAVGAMGSGFLTKDHTEFLMTELGAGVSYVFARNLQAYGNGVYQIRYRKGLKHGPGLYAGVRVLFD